MHNTPSTSSAQPSLLSSLTSAPVLVFGCGNTLMGDDGFGPAVIEHLLAHYRLPPWVVAQDMGTSIRDYLFDLLLAPPFKRLILIVDSCRQPGQAPGSLLRLGLDQVDPAKAGDFAVHQFPSLNLLAELAGRPGTSVELLAAQIVDLPHEVRPGLSTPVAGAVPRAAREIWQRIRGIDHVEGQGR